MSPSSPRSWDARRRPNACPRPNARPRLTGRRWPPRLRATESRSFLALPASEPPHDCPLCPRLAQFRGANREKFPDWWNAPVPSWGDAKPRLVIVGLAPGLKGANRTGRPFTGDYAGTLLFSTLLKFGLATGVFEARPDDSFRLKGALIVNAVRCVP